MNIAILGTRGIPNNYGGFEQFAEYLSKGLVQKGHKVIVYNSNTHTHQEATWQGVGISHQYDPEDIIGTAGQFIYDLNCILHARKMAFDVILQLGYTSNSIWGKLLPKEAIIVTNMDGLEWKRSKHPKPVQLFLKKAESWAVKSSDYLISDSVGIQDYLKKEHSKDSQFIAYGANTFIAPDFRKVQDTLEQVEKYKYDLLISRLEPENHIEEILQGFKESDVDRKLLLVGNYSNKFGTYLLNKYGLEKRIIFLGGIYNLEVLDNLRYFSNLYFHGHSVGGTNPSLLEAMASGAFICAHKNVFNEAILGRDALYFCDVADLTEIISSTIKKRYQKHIELNFKKIENIYNWPLIIDKYEKFLTFAFQKGKKKS